MCMKAFLFMLNVFILAHKWFIQLYVLLYAYVFHGILCCIYTFFIVYSIRNDKINL